MTARCAHRKLLTCAAALGLLLGLFPGEALSAARAEGPVPGSVPSAPAPSLQPGDCWQYRNLRVKRGIRETVRCVTKTLEDGYVMETAGRVTGLARYDRNLVWISSIGADRTLRTPARRPPLRLSFPLWPGKNWKDAYRTLDTSSGGFADISNIYIVEAFEQVEVPAGRFSAFRIKRIRINASSGEVAEGLTWYAPDIENIVQVWNDWPGGTKMVLSAYQLARGRGPAKPEGPGSAPPGQMRASHILVNEESAALEVLRRIKAGEAFDALAREISVDPSKRFGGDIGYFKEGELLPALEEVLRGLKIGEVGGPVRTEHGYHILKRTG